jgi:hypothetical protein
MGKRGPKAEAKMRYWQLFRTGHSQSEIARQFGISRQAVSKSVGFQQRDVLFRLLESARASRMLVEWTDATKGALIGIIPDLENMACLIMVDESGQIQYFYDPERNNDHGLRVKQRKELEDLLKTCLKISIKRREPFKNILDKIILA